MSIVKKIKRHKSLLESFFSLSILNGLNVLLPLITLPYILRVVGTENYGIYSYVFVLIQYLLLLSSYGFNFSATKQISQHRNDIEKLNTIYNSVIVGRIVLLFCGLIIFILLSPYLLPTANKKFIFLLGLGIVLGDILNPIWLYQGLEKMRYITIVNVISKFIFTILVFIMIKKSDDYIYIILINSCGFLLSGIISIFIVKKQFNLKLSRPKLNDIKYQFKEGLALFGSTIGTNLYSNANIFILNFFVSSSHVGIYAAAEKIIKGLQSLTTPITQALFPRISNIFLGQSTEYQLSKLKEISKILFLILIVPNILVFFGADFLVKMFCGANFQDSTILVKIMSPVIIIGTLNYVLGVVGLVNLNQQKIFFVGVMIAGFISIIFLIVTVPYLNIKAASLAVPISELCLLIICVIKLYKLNRNTHNNLK